MAAAYSVQCRCRGGVRAVSVVSDLRAAFRRGWSTARAAIWRDLATHMRARHSTCPPRDGYVAQRSSPVRRTDRDRRIVCWPQHVRWWFDWLLDCIACFATSEIELRSGLTMRCSQPLDGVRLHFC
jgi:hypothetical protein